MRADQKLTSPESGLLHCWVAWHVSLASSVLQTFSRLPSSSLLPRWAIRLVRWSPAALALAFRREWHCPEDERRRRLCKNTYSYRNA